MIAALVERLKSGDLTEAQLQHENTVLSLAKTYGVKETTALEARHAALAQFRADRSPI